MFVAHCDQCGGRQLLGAGRVSAIQNLTRGVVAVELRCHRGHRLVLLTGGGRPPVQVRPADPRTPAGPAGGRSP